MAKTKKVKKATPPKPRNQQDATLRNTRAASRRMGLFEDQVGAFATAVQDLVRRVEALEVHTRINTINTPNTP